MSGRTLVVPTLLLAALAACAPEPADDSVPLDPSVVLPDAPIADDASYAPDRVLVGFHQPGLPGALELSGAELPQLRQFGKLRIGAYEVPAGMDVPQTVEALRATGRYAFVEPDYVRTASVNDPYRSYQWNFDKIDAEGAWAYSVGSGVVVAVIDTGSTSGPYDGLGSVSGGYDFANGDSNPADDNGHGTHVAGTIAQASDNGAGVAGLAYGATIMPVKVLDASGNGYTSDVVDGINYAVSNGANVINMSLGSSAYSSSEASAVLNAYNSGVFVAAASGNSNGTSVDYPGGYTGAVAVGATDFNNARAPYSSRGSALDLMAPGGDTSADANGDGYADGVLQETFSGSTWSYYFFQGTSMATPHVAGAAALLMSAGASNVEAEECLVATATDLGASGFDTSYGHGLIQPAAALAAYQAGSCGSGGVDTGDTADTGTPDTGTPSYSCPAGYATFTGTLTGTGDVDTIDVDGDGDTYFYVASRTTIDVLLEGEGPDFDLYLYQYSRRWRLRDSSTGSTSSEQVSYTGNGYIRIEVESYSGAGDYTVCVAY